MYLIVILRWFPNVGGAYLIQDSICFYDIGVTFHVTPNSEVQKWATLMSVNILLEVTST